MGDLGVKKAEYTVVLYSVIMYAYTDGGDQLGMRRVFLIIFRVTGYITLVSCI